MKDFASNLLTPVNVIRINLVYAVADYVFATCLGNLLRQKLGGFASCHLLFSVWRRVQQSANQPLRRRSDSDVCSSGLLLITEKIQFDPIKCKLEKQNCPKLLNSNSFKTASILAVC